MYFPDPIDKVIRERIESARQDGAIWKTIRKMGELWEEYDELRKQHQECIKQLQLACPHVVLREFPAGDGSWGTFKGPVSRYCYVCRLIEEGPDFTLLTSVPVLTRPYDPLEENFGGWPPLSR